MPAGGEGANGGVQRRRKDRDLIERHRRPADRRSGSAAARGPRPRPPLTVPTEATWAHGAASPATWIRAGRSGSPPVADTAQFASGPQVQHQHHDQPGHRDTEHHGEDDDKCRTLQLLALPDVDRDQITTVMPRLTNRDRTRRCAGRPVVSGPDRTASSSVIGVMLTQPSCSDIVRRSRAGVQKVAPRSSQGARPCVVGAPRGVKVVPRSAGRDAPCGSGSGRRGTTRSTARSPAPRRR